MTIYTVNHKISLSEYQDSFLIDGTPECEFCLQKGIKHVFDVDLNGKRSLYDSSVWIKYNNDNDDFVLVGDGSTKCFELTKIEAKTDLRNSLLLKYTPRLVCTFDDFNVETWDDSVISFVENFKFFDFLTGHNIKGSNSGATAFIEKIGMGCTECGGLFISACYRDLEGEFEFNEPIEIVDLDLGLIHERYESERGFFDQIANGFIEKLLETANTPYITASEDEFDERDCILFETFENFPNNESVDFFPYAQEKTIFRNCIEEKQHIITLDYTPDLICNFGDLELDNMSDELYFEMSNFPYKDFLTGQRIRGGYSGALGTVESVILKRSNVPCSPRVIVICMTNVLGNFVEKEPIEITTLPQKSILDEWQKHFSKYDDAPEFVQRLIELHKTPYSTANNEMNAIHSRFFDTLEEEFKSSFGITIDNKSLDRSEYTIDISLSSSTSLECDDGCFTIPENRLIVTVCFANAPPDGSIIKFKNNIVPYVINNGAENGEQIIIEIPPESYDVNLYMNMACYEFDTPLEFEIKKMSLNSNHIKLFSLISDPVRCEYPNFENFMRMYFAYDDRFGGAQNFLSNLHEYGNVDTTLSKFLKSFAKENMPEFLDVPEFVGSRFLQKEIINFYNSAGTKQSCDFLIKTLFNEGCEICKPRESVFMASADNYRVRKHIHVKFSETTIPNDVNTTLEDVLKAIENILTNSVGQYIRGIESGSVGVIEDIDKYVDMNDETIFRIEIVKSVGEFENNEELEILRSNGTDFQTNISNEFDNEISYLNEISRERNYLLNIGGMLNGISIINFSGKFFYRDQLFLDVGSGNQNGKILVDRIVNGNPITIFSDHSNGSNNSFIDGQTIRLKKVDAGNNEIGFIEGIVRTTNVEIGQGFWETRNSFTDDIVVITDNCRADPNTYVLKTPVSRNEYEEIYNSTLKEAGTFMLSEYPVEIDVECVSNEFDCNVYIETPDG